MKTTQGNQSEPALEPIPSDARGAHVEIASRIADLQRQRQERKRQRLAAEPSRHVRIGLGGRLQSVARFLFS